jgi:hypothetical protein
MDIDMAEIKPTEGMVTLTHVIYALHAFSAAMVSYGDYPSAALRTGSEQLTHD